MELPLPPPPPPKRSFLKRHKNLILVDSLVILAAFVLICPFIPLSRAVTQTRTRNLQYNSDVYGLLNIPRIVNVTNTDVVGGSFTITMYYYENDLALTNGVVQSTPQLQDTSSQSSYISPGGTMTFYLPSNWTVESPFSSFTYSVSTDSIQEPYSVTQTEFKSVLSLIINH